MTNQPIFSVEISRKIESAVISELGSEFELMERAGLACFNAVMKHYPNITSCCTMVGKGNNGVDGLLLSAQLQAHGIKTQVILTAGQIEYGNNFKKALALAKSSGVIVKDNLPSPDEAIFDVYVDAILGIGLIGTVREAIIPFISYLNEIESPIVAIDVPSGVLADQSSVAGPAVVADLLVGLLNYKLAYFTGPALNYFSVLEFNDLGASSDDYLANNALMFGVDFDACYPMLRQRLSDSHKGTYGRVFVIAPYQKSLLGACLLAAKSASKMGCGQVVLAVDPDVATSVASEYPYLSVIADHSIENLTKHVKDEDVIILGPGLGVDKKSIAVVKWLLARPNKKILDADALNIIAKSPGIKLDDHAILTPHPKEAARLLSTHTELVQNNRCKALTELVDQYCCNVVLKGAGTLIKTADNKDSAYVCIHHCPSMAVAGMGDVLAGMIASLWAQGLDASSAMRLGVTWHAFHGMAIDETDGKLGLDLDRFLTTLHGSKEAHKLYASQKKQAHQCSAKIQIVEYNPRWQYEYSQLHCQIWPHIRHVALGMEHIGSTAVSGLVAKPTIDLDIIVASEDDVNDCIDVLTTIGYRHLGDCGVPGREAFSVPPGLFPHHLYVCVDGAIALRNHLVLRDHLRIHSKDADLYSDLKKDLALKHANDRKAYVEGKTAFIQTILARYGLFFGE